MAHPLDLDAETTAFLDRRVAAGDDVDAVIGAGLRLLAEQERHGDAVLAELDRAAIRRSIERDRESGLTFSEAEVFDVLEQELNEKEAAARAVG